MGMKICSYYKNKKRSDQTVAYCRKLWYNEEKQKIWLFFCRKPKNKGIAI